MNDHGAGAAGEVPLVATFHSPLVLEDKEAALHPFPRGIPQRIALAWDAWRLRRFARRVDASIAVSPYVADRMRSAFGFDPTVIPNGVRPLVESGEIELVPPFEHVVLSLGRLVEVKAIDRAIEALFHLPNEVGLVVAGRGPDRERLETTAIELGLENRVSFVGFVSEKEKAAWLRLADAFVLPSKEEGQGIVALEALQAGTPVAITNQAWLPEELQGFVYPAPLHQGVEGLAEAIRKALGAPEIQKAPVHSWSEVARKTKAVYERVAP